MRKGHRREYIESYELGINESNIPLKTSKPKMKKPEYYEKKSGEKAIKTVI